MSRAPARAGRAAGARAAPAGAPRAPRWPRRRAPARARGARATRRAAPTRAGEARRRAARHQNSANGSPSSRGDARSEHAPRRHRVDEEAAQVERVALGERERDAPSRSATRRRSMRARAAPSPGARCPPAPPGSVPTPGERGEERAPPGTATPNSASRATTSRDAAGAAQPPPGAAAAAAPPGAERPSGRRSAGGAGAPGPGGRSGALPRPRPSQESAAAPPRSSPDRPDEDLLERPGAPRTSSSVPCATSRPCVDDADVRHEPLHHLEHVAGEEDRRPRRWPTRSWSRRRMPGHRHARRCPRTARRGRAGAGRG